MYDKQTDVGVVGAGYVGLVTGACLAHAGHRVTIVDRDAGLVAKLSEGLAPIHEPGLEELLAGGLRQGRLSFTTRTEEAILGAEVLFIAVDTPQGGDGAADLSNVAAVARTVGKTLAGPGARRGRPLVVVNKSTVPAGSADYVSMLIQEDARPGDCLVVSNPEFLREGSAVHDALFPDRIVLGADSEDALRTMRDLYEPITQRRFPPVPGIGDPSDARTVPVLTTDPASAEMIKYAANAFLATKVSFINEIANVCELVGADVKSVAGGMGLDGRIGPRFLDAGIGWGGSCLPKNVSALRSIAREYGYEPALLDAASAVNEGQRGRVVAKLQEGLRTLKGKRVALLGLAFKPGTDDLRRAPSLEIAEHLCALGARVVGYDPVAGGAAAEVLPELEVAGSPYDALADAHAAVLVTEWEELRCIDLDLASAPMRDPRLLVDGRNVLDPASASAAGLRYRGFGVAENARATGTPEPPNVVGPPPLPRVTEALRTSWNRPTPPWPSTTVRS